MKLTLTSNTDQPVIRVEDGQAYTFKGRDMYATIYFTAEDLRQLNEFAATCPMFGCAAPSWVNCSDCNGLGFYDGIGDRCETCKGFGKTPLRETSVAPMPPEMKSHTDEVARQIRRNAWVLCIGDDPLCPCKDGDECHYKGENPWPIKGDV